MAEQETRWRRDPDDRRDIDRDLLESSRRLAREGDYSPDLIADMRRLAGAGHGAGEDVRTRGDRAYEPGGPTRRAEPERDWWNPRRDGFRGLGPRRYTRSDERIREDVSDRLMDDGYVDASDITVTVAGGEVALDGTVDSRMAKRRAEDIAGEVSGVRNVQNNLRVRPAAEGGMATDRGQGDVTPWR